MKLTREEILNKYDHMYDSSGRTAREDEEAFADWILAQWPDEPDGQFIRVPPESEWPLGATKLVLIARNGYNYIKDIVDFPRPRQAWRPKEGDKVWIKPVHMSCLDLVVWNDGDHNMEIIEFIASAESLDEITWTRDQFRQRGRVWDSVK